MVKEDDGAPVLIRFPPDDEVGDGELMSIIRLRNSISLSEYRTVHKKPIKPLIRSLDEDKIVVMILIPVYMLRSLPNGV